MSKNPAMPRKSTQALPGSLTADLLEGLNLPVVVTDPNQPDNPIVYVSNTFANMTGYAAEDCVGRNCRFLQGPETDPAAVERLRAAIKAGHAETTDLLNYRADGSAFINRLLVAPLYGGHGEVEAYIGVQQEVFSDAPGTALGQRLHRRMAFAQVAMERLDDVLEDLLAGEDGSVAFAWDIARGTLYAPGAEPGMGGGIRDAQAYLAQVHPDDRDGLQRRIAAAFDSPNAEFDHAYRVGSEAEGWVTTGASGRFVYVGESATPTLICVTVDT